MTVGERIKKVRLEKGLSQKELGEKLGVSQQMIGQYEHPSSNLKAETIGKIAGALNISTIALLMGTPSEIKAEHYKQTEKSETSPSEEFHINVTEKALLTNYRKLNVNGKKEARKRVEELTEIPRYTEPADIDVDTFEVDIIDDEEF